MLRSFIIGILLFCTLVISQEEEAIFVNEDQFDQMLATHPNVLTLFTRMNSGCTECLSAINAIEDFISEGLPCKTVIVDCQIHRKLCKRFDLAKYPTILLFNEDYAIYEFDKPAIFLSNLRNFVQKHAVEKTHKINSVEEFKDLISKFKVAIVAFLSDPQNQQKEIGSFRRTAGNLFENYDFIEFIIEKNEENDKFMEENDFNYDSFYLLNFYGGEKKIEKFEGAPTRKKFISWIELESPWIVHKLDQFENFSDLKEKYKSLPTFTAFFPQDAFPSQESLIRELEIASGSFKHEILFSYYPFAPEYKDVLLKWGFTEDKYPAMIISSPSAREVFTYKQDDQEILAAQIEEFCNDYLSGKLKPHTIKQTKVEKSKFVKTLIHDNYHKIVHDNTKDVLVYFYLPADQCGHCDKFLTEFEQVAEKLANTDNLVFAKLDVSANSQIPGLHVHNFPTIRLFKTDAKFKDVSYFGDRTADSLSKWISQNTAKKKIPENTLNSDII